MSPAKSVVLAVLLLSTPAWPREPTSSGEPAAATLKRDLERCRAHGNLDECYDAIRWHPSDPALLVALGDALTRANRPSDAIRVYRRADALVTNMPGVAAKISAAEAKLSSQHATGNQAIHGASIHAPPGKHYSNAATEAQSH